MNREALPQKSINVVMSFVIVRTGFVDRSCAFGKQGIHEITRSKHEQNNCDES
jgi:hypothetical protein